MNRIAGSLFVVCLALGCGRKEPEYPPSTTHPTSAEQPGPAVTAQPKAQPLPKAEPIRPQAPVTAPPAAPTPAPMTTAPATIPPTGVAPAPGTAETAPAPSEAATHPDDRSITKTVRAVIIADKALSAHAKAIRITTVRGRVTLHGTVMSDQEKTEIENRIKPLPGVVSIDDLLIVKKK
jgi:hypothetical protein